jgi:tetratricopeptide (TPR) repeat protein
MNSKTLCMGLLLSLNVWAQGLNEVYARADKAVAEKRYDEALELYKQAFGKDPKSSKALSNIGWIYNEQRKYETAARWLRQAQKLAPGDYEIQCELGFAAHKLGQSQEALKAFTQATTLKPDLARAWQGLGDAQHELKRDYKAATQAYLKAIEAGSKEWLVLYRLGWGLNQMEQFESAAGYLKKAVEVQPKAAVVWLEWGYALMNNQQLPEAAEALTRAVVLDPNLKLGRLYLGQVFLQQGRRDLVQNEIDSLRQLDEPSARKLEELLKASPQK